MCSDLIDNPFSRLNHHTTGHWRRVIIKVHKLYDLEKVRPFELFVIPRDNSNCLFKENKLLNVLECSYVTQSFLESRTNEKVI